MHIILPMMKCLFTTSKVVIIDFKQHLKDRIRQAVYLFFPNRALYSGFNPHAFIRCARTCKHAFQTRSNAQFVCHTEVEFGSGNQCAKWINLCQNDWFIRLKSMISHHPKSETLWMVPFRIGRVKRSQTTTTCTSYSALLEFLLLQGHIQTFIKH